jgi:hypothetical protein
MIEEMLVEMFRNRQKLVVEAMESSGINALWLSEGDFVIGKTLNKFKVNKHLESTLSHIYQMAKTRQSYGWTELLAEISNPKNPFSVYQKAISLISETIQNSGETQIPEALAHIALLYCPQATYLADIEWRKSKVVQTPETKCWDGTGCISYDLLFSHAYSGKEPSREKA